MQTKKQNKMEKIKLEVGKTYRSRRGKDVKIVRKDNQGWCPCQGDDGEWYTESGGFEYCIERPEDLIEEVTRHTFAIPDGVKKVTVEQVSNRIVVEMVPEEGPKPGDVMINENGSVYIFKETVDYSTHRDFAWLGKTGRLAIGGKCYSGRPATPEEAKPLFDALKKAGKRWDAETMEVEEIPEFDRILEWVEENFKCGYYNREDVAEAIEGYLTHKEGEK